MRWTERLTEEALLRMTPKRFRVSVEDIRKQRYTYFVCTCLDDRKALVIAATHHDDRHGAAEARVYQVVEVTPVEGDRLYDSDLCDRAEW